MTDITLHLTIHELCEYEEITQETIIEVVEYGIAEPLSGESKSEWLFDLDNAYWIKKAAKLHQQFQIDWVATALVVELLKQKDELEKENGRLKTRLDRLL